MAETSGNIAPFIILVALLGTVILYAISVQPVERERLIGPLVYERFAVDANPGIVSAVPRTTLKGSHDLGIVQLDYSPQPSPRVLSQRISVRDSLVSDADAAFTIDVDKTDLSSASVEFNIVDKEGVGDLVVTLNNVAVFTGSLSRGANSVELPTDQLQQGPNTLRISTTKANVFGSSAYSLSNVNFVPKNYFPAKAVSTQTVTLSQQEITGLISAQLTGFVKQLSKDPARMSLKLNDKEIYAAAPISETTIALDLPPSLIKGTNVLEWSVGRGGAYEIVFGRLSTVYGRTPSQVKSYVFSISSFELEGAAIGQYNCWLQINSTATGNVPISVQINSNTLKLQLRNGMLQEDICRYLLVGDNFLSLYPSSDLDMQNLRVHIRGKF